MRAWPAFVLAIFVIIPGASNAAPVAHAAAWWTALPASARGAALATLMEGFTRGWAAEHFRVRGLTETGRSPAWSYEYSMEKPPRFQKPLRIYVRAIDHFYAAHRDARYVPVVNILDCLSDVPFRSCDAVANDAENILR